MGLSALFADLSYLFEIFCSSEGHSLTLILINISNIGFWNIEWNLCSVVEEYLSSKMYSSGFEQCCNMDDEPLLLHNSEIGDEFFLGSSKYVYLDRKVSV